MYTYSLLLCENNWFWAAYCLYLDIIILGFGPCSRDLNALWLIWVGWEQPLLIWVGKERLVGINVVGKKNSASGRRTNEDNGRNGRSARVTCR